MEMQRGYGKQKVCMDFGTQEYLFWDENVAEFRDLGFGLIGFGLEANCSPKTTGSTQSQFVTNIPCSFPWSLRAHLRKTPASALNSAY